MGSLTVTLEALKPLGVTPDKIKLVQSDTKRCPDSGMSASSRSHFMNSSATKLAADKLIPAMRKPDGTYRTYDEMVAEGIDTKYEATFTSVEAADICRLIQTPELAILLLHITICCLWQKWK